MKCLNYKYLSCEVNQGTDDTPDLVPMYLDKSVTWNEANEAIAKAEAYNGEYTIEDDGEPEPVAPPTTAELAADLASVQSASAITFVTLCEIGTIDDTTASEHMELFAPWAHPINYKMGNIRSYSDKLYRCLQDHTSQETWTPEDSPSLWVAISDPTEEWPEWSQPIGSTDAYAKGAKVSHADKKWTSDVDNNVWEPGVYGWTEYKEFVKTDTTSTQGVKLSEEESYRLPSISKN